MCVPENGTELWGDLSRSRVGWTIRQEATACREVWREWEGLAPFEGRTRGVRILHAVLLEIRGSDRFAFQRTRQRAASEAAFVAAGELLEFVVGAAG
jgi:hypothetical protein